MNLIEDRFKVRFEYIQDVHKSPRYIYFIYDKYSGFIIDEYKESNYRGGNFFANQICKAYNDEDKSYLKEVEKYINPPNFFQRLFS